MPVSTRQTVLTVFTAEKAVETASAFLGSYTRLKPSVNERGWLYSVLIRGRFRNLIALLHESGIKRTFVGRRSSRDDASASYRERPAFFARCDAAGPRLGQPEQEALDGFARSASHLCDRFGEWNCLERKGSARNSMGRGCRKRRTPFYHRRRS